MDDRLKVLILGLTVMNAVGEGVLDSAVTSIKHEIPDSATTPSKRRGGLFGRGDIASEVAAVVGAEPSSTEPAPAPQATPNPKPAPDAGG
jgi:hypothetical protein